MLEADLVERLRSVLQSGPKLQLAVLFGSAARGTDRPDSDLDIGILPADPELALFDELALQARLAAVAGREIDLVRLDRTRPMLRFRAAREGLVLLAETPVEWTRFRARAGIEHADIAPHVQSAGELFRSRLAAGSATPTDGKQAER
jgi:predicted nucleotidyltransferase